jgi:hypothetical protein
MILLNWVNSQANQKFVLEVANLCVLSILFKSCGNFLIHEFSSELFFLRKESSRLASPNKKQRNTYRNIITYTKHT